ncbi:hypothetical protein BC829DRAFT_430956, partial [Chytridium lagenaria]
MNMSASSPPRPSEIHSPSSSSHRGSLKAQAAAIQTTNAISSALAASLVKEYLAAKGLEKTLEAFRLEYLQFQKAPLVTSRSELSKQLGVGKILNQNRTSDQPLKSQLEVIVKSLSTKASSSAKESKQISTSDPKLSKRSTSPSSGPSTRPTSSSSTVGNHHPAPLKNSPPSVVTFNTPLGGFDSKNPRALSAGMSFAAGSPSTNTTSISTTRIGSASSYAGTTPPISAGWGAKDGNTVTTNWMSSTNNSDQPTLPPSRTSIAVGGNTDYESPRTFRSSTASKHHGDLEITEDIGFDDDDDDDSDDFNRYGASKTFGGPRVNSLGPAAVSKGSLITTQKALMLRKVTFAGTGTEDSRSRSTFPDEWKGKGFVFNNQASEISYGLIQSRGGPCGLLAVVQAFVLKHLAFGQDSSAVRSGKLRPTATQCKTALIEAISEILWLSGGTRSRKAVVALFKPNLRVQAKSDLSRERYIPDGITENLELHEFTDSLSLRDFLSHNLDSFLNNDPSRHGLIQLLYSAVLSRGAETIRDEDFDEPGCSLIGRHAYCTQVARELVNLLMMGQAISNVHDGDIHLGGSGEDVKVLK